MSILLRFHFKNELILSVGQTCCICTENAAEDVSSSSAIYKIKPDRTKRITKLSLKKIDKRVL